MRYRLNYTLYKRGKYWYYRTYDKDGKRTCGKSTGQTVKTKAILLCEELLKTGNLFNNKTVTFAKYATGFFDEGSHWYIDKCLDSVDGTMPISYNRLRLLRGMLNVHLLPYWGSYNISDITLYELKKFRSIKIEDGYAVGSVEQMFACLKIIIDMAVSDNIISVSPFVGLKSVRVMNKTNKSSFTDDEVISICLGLNTREYSLWFFVTAICTGMRFSEVLAIRKETVCDGYILCKDQLHKHENTLIPTKTKKSRYIPVPAILNNKLRCMADDREFCFSRSDGVYVQNYLRQLASQTNGSFSLHSARHYFNTYLLSKNVSSVKVAAVLGHTIKEVGMQERYTNWEPTHFPEIVKEQEVLLDRILNSFNLDKT